MEKKKIWFEGEQKIKLERVYIETNYLKKKDEVV